MEYLVGGYTMLNDFDLKDGRQLRDVLGGSVFSAAGIRLWRDSVAYIGAAGEDFDQYYGPYFEANGIRVSVKKPVKYTLRYQMKYIADGSWEENCRYGEAYEEEASRLCALDASQFAPYCDENTKGIYLEASLHAPITGQFGQLKRMMPNGKLMWEITTGDLLAPGRHAQVLKKIEETDAFSMNLNEAKVFFGLDTLDDVLEELHKIGKPCFFRAGEKGAYMLQDGQTAFLPAVGTAESVDPTGCGNCSTAASLVGYAEGLGPWQTTAMANVAAGFNARQYGPWPLVTPQVRSEARQQRDMLLQHAAKT